MTVDPNWILAVYGAIGGCATIVGWIIWLHRKLGRQSGRINMQAGKLEAFEKILTDHEHRIRVTEDSKAALARVEEALRWIRERLAKL